MNTIEGKLTAKGRSFALVAARFNSFITDRLVEGALDVLKRHEADEKKVTLVRVPGAFEIPIVAKRLAESSRYDAVICLGAVIRGATPHFEYVAAEAAKGVAQVALQSGCPVVFGILTCDSLEQAVERAGAKAGNKGADAALAAMEMASLLPQL